MIDPQAIAAHLLAIVLGWTPATIPHVTPGELVPDIAAVLAEEGPAIPGDETGQKTAVMLAGLAYFEGARFASYVDTGACNDGTAGKLIAYGHCDQGHAFSLWQVHPLTWRDGKRVEAFDSARLRNRHEAARAALLLIRSSYRARGNLSGYTGEAADTHPKADEREAFARRFWSR